MRKTQLATILFISLAFSGCTKAYDCEDPQLVPAFVRFLPAEINTFVIRKYQANTNFQNLVDSIVVSLGGKSQYYTSNDTTSVFVTDGRNGIRAGYDWQLYIPARNRTVSITEIVSEKKRGKQVYGIFSMDKKPGCVNFVYSVKVDNQLKQFSTTDNSANFIFINN